MGEQDYIAQRTAGTPFCASGLFPETRGVRQTKQEMTHIRKCI